MTAQQIAFWCALGMVAYTYVGYGVLVTVINRLLGRHRVVPRPLADEDLPSVTVLVAAWNEADCIEKKIRNTFDLDYPADRLRVLVVSDGSDDATPQLVAALAETEPRLRGLHQDERQGKTAAVNRAIEFVDTDLVVLNDANTDVNPEALRRLAAHFADPAVGGVSGEKRVAATNRAAGAGENLYWRYESFLKREDARLHTLVGSAGELYGMRTSLFTPLPLDTVLDDFMQSMLVVQNGFRFGYEPDAFASEPPSPSTRDEAKRKIRNAAGGFQAMARLKPMLNPRRHPVATFQYVSHRVLRWWGAPLGLASALVLNAVIVVAGGPAFYAWLLAGQAVFYGLAALGWVMAERGLRWRPAFVPFYFTYMNVLALAGLVRWARGRQTPLWPKIARSPGADPAA